MLAKEYPSVIMETKLPLPLFIRGKVRDTYDLGNHLLLVATDRISAFDVVLPNGILWKGFVLNQLSLFWFRRTADIIPSHLLEPVDELKDLDSYLTEGQRFNYPDYLVGRSMIVTKVKRIPVECVVRGYLAGSAWAEYQEAGTVNGRRMPKGMQESEKLSETIFTPTTKADTGHDQPINDKELTKLAGKEFARIMEEKTRRVYDYAAGYALTKDIIIADTKLEFGVDEDERLILIDELLTPDSSRFWDTELYQVGKSQPSLDKQPVRDWLVEAGWNKEPPAPELPPEVAEVTTQRYIAAYERLTGRSIG
ncbi:phosphoribosylaminoimidazolesuccinocarboxamide synthase [Chloroflexota bacterium]